MGDQELDCMNRNMRITIHHNPAIPWHTKRLNQFSRGLKVLGFDPISTTSRKRVSDDPAILFGTSGFKEVESAEGDWLLVDRACFLDPYYVRLGWNGRGMEADYKIPEDHTSERFESLGIKTPVKESGDRIILCGDYDAIPKPPQGVIPTHFKPHPAPGAAMRDDLPIVENFEDAKVVICGRSTVAFDALMDGRWIHVTDPNSMAKMMVTELAYTQWSWDEIQSGEPIRHLFEWLKSKDSKS